MNVQVIDLYMGGEIRPISSLSGGELFLASLALALGLASLAGQRTRVETVFIDEGFGSLDARTLDTALSALEVLQSEGRQVGIVSHVAALNERVGAQVLVQKVGADRSIVKVEAGR
jgi:exonuclease SbcC